MDFNVLGFQVHIDKTVALLMVMVPAALAMNLPQVARLVIRIRARFRRKNAHEQERERLTGAKGL